MRVLDCEELRAKAASDPGDFTFAQVCKLAECAGFQAGSGDAFGRAYVREGATPGDPDTITLQNDNGLARATDVRDLLDWF